MSLIQLLQVIFCVTIVALGQILFKLGAESITASNDKGVYADFNAYIIVALIIYALSTVIWIYILRSIPLSIAYPFMSLSFILVPIASYYVFGDPINLKILTGGFFIFIGFYLVAS